MNLPLQKFCWFIDYRHHYAAFHGIINELLRNMLLDYCFEVLMKERLKLL